MKKDRVLKKNMRFVHGKASASGQSMRITTKHWNIIKLNPEIKFETYD